MSDTNGAERPAGFDPPPQVNDPNDRVYHDALVLKVVGQGATRTGSICSNTGLTPMQVDNTLRRLKQAGKVQYLGQAADQGWRIVNGVFAKYPKRDPNLVEKTMNDSLRELRASAKKASKPRKKVARRTVAAKKATKKPKGRHHVHCVLPTKLFNHVKAKLEEGETFTDAIIAGLTNEYGEPK